jgi:hypothetical protein
MSTSSSAGAFLPTNTHQCLDVDIHDSSHAVTNVPAQNVTAGAGIVVDDKQAWPVIGWLEASWVPRQRGQGPRWAAVVGVAAAAAPAVATLAFPPPRQNCDGDRPCLPAVHRSELTSGLEMVTVATLPHCRAKPKSFLGALLS